MVVVVLVVVLVVEGAKSRGSGGSWKGKSLALVKV